MPPGLPPHRHNRVNRVEASLVAMVAAHGPPRGPGDLEDHRGDREADQRIGDRQAEGDDDRAGDDGEADVGVGPSVVAVGDQRRAVEGIARTGPDDRRDPVAAEADQASGGKREQLMLGSIKPWLWPWPPWW